MNYKEKEFKSVSSGDLGIEEDQTSTEEEVNENKDLFDFMKKDLSDK